MGRALGAPMHHVRRFLHQGGGVRLAPQQSERHLRHPERLGDEEREQFAVVLARCPELKALHAHVRDFAGILQNRSGQHLKDWTTATRTADLPRLHAFATGLEKDWDAVVQGLSTRWNSGPVEGRVNHIKMIKGQCSDEPGSPYSANVSSSPRHKAATVTSSALDRTAS
ncbi:transposase [Streptomyces sp. NPDC018833]|uniref:transposase n=1 Tax=Streptomyces sp. NPDC018833 TaxID=3365053 RepID=UPI00379B49A1